MCCWLEETRAKRIWQLKSDSPCYANTNGGSKPIEEVTPNAKPDAPATESVTRGSEQAGEITFLVRIQLHQTSTVEGIITGMPTDRVITMLDDLMDKHSVTQLRKISDLKSHDYSQQDGGQHEICAKNQAR